MSTTPTHALSEINSRIQFMDATVSMDESSEQSPQLREVQQIWEGELEDSATRPTMSKLLTLPTKLREQIWNLVIVTDEPVRRLFHWEPYTGRRIIASLLCVNRFLHEECSPIFYSHNLIIPRLPRDFRFIGTTEAEIKSRQSELVGTGLTYLPYIRKLGFNITECLPLAGSLKLNYDVLEWILSMARDIQTVEIFFPYMPNPYYDSYGKFLEALKDWAYGFVGNDHLFHLLSKDSKIKEVLLTYNDCCSAQCQSDGAPQIGHDHKGLCKSHTLITDPWIEWSIREPHIALKSDDMIAIQLSCRLRSRIEYQKLERVQWQRAVKQGCSSCSEEIPVAEVNDITRPSALLALPAEIREIIWSYCIGSGAILIKRKSTIFNPPAFFTLLPCVNRQIEAECAYMIYERNHIYPNKIGFWEAPLDLPCDIVRAIDIPPRYYKSVRSVVIDLRDDPKESTYQEELFLFIRKHVVNLQAIKLRQAVWEGSPAVWGTLDVWWPHVLGNFFMDLNLPIVLTHQERLCELLTSMQRLHIVDLTIFRPLSWRSKITPFNLQLRQRPQLSLVSEDTLESIRKACFSSAQKAAVSKIVLYENRNRHHGRADENTGHRWIVELEPRAPAASPRLSTPWWLEFENLFEDVTPPTQ